MLADCNYALEVIVRSLQRNWVRECWRSFGCERPGMNTANPHQSWKSSLIVLESKMASSRLLHVSFHEKYLSMASQHPGFFGFVFKCSAPFIVSMKMFESKCSMKKYAIGTPNRATVGRVRPRYDVSCLLKLNAADCIEEQVNQQAINQCQSKFLLKQQQKRFSTGGR